MKGYMRYVLAYVLWAVSFVAAGVVGFTSRDALVNALTLAAAPKLQQDPTHAFYTGMQVRATAVWTYPILGVVLVILMLLIEHWYRQGVPKRRLLARFLAVTAGTTGVLCFAHGLYFIVAATSGFMSWRGVLLPGAELAATILLVWLYARCPKTPVASIHSMHHGAAGAARPEAVRRLP